MYLAIWHKCITYFIYHIHINYICRCVHPPQIGDWAECAKHFCCFWLELSISGRIPSVQPSFQFGGWRPYIVFPIAWFFSQDFWALSERIEEENSNPELSNFWTRYALRRVPKNWKIVVLVVVVIYLLYTSKSFDNQLFCW